MPGGHIGWQTPLKHCSVLWHAWPQEPQLEESLRRSTHSEPHCVKPSGHVTCCVPLPRQASRRQVASSGRIAANQ
jgi:hypothetical protein